MIERQYYDPWGKRRNGDGTDADTLRSLDHRMGYTGHEHLDAVGLVHMNGRVYDPMLARFMSADPTVPDPTDGQNFNRFTYVLNNPLGYTDPSGFAQVREAELTMGSTVGAGWATERMLDASLGGFSDQLFGDLTFKPQPRREPTAEERRLRELQKRFSCPAGAICIHYLNPAEQAAVGLILRAPAGAVSAGTIANASAAAQAAATRAYDAAKVATRVDWRNVLRAPNPVMVFLALALHSGNAGDPNEGAIIASINAAGRAAQAVLNAEAEGEAGANSEGSGKRTVDDLIGESTAGRETKGRADQYIHGGGREQRDKDFDSLGATDVKDRGNGTRTGTLPDGRPVNVHDSKTDGVPTIQIGNGSREIKIRYP